LFVTLISCCHAYLSRIDDRQTRLNVIVRVGVQHGAHYFAAMLCKRPPLVVNPSNDSTAPSNGSQANNNRVELIAFVADSYRMDDVSSNTRPEPIWLNGIVSLLNDVEVDSM
jgi:hypothetical protein